MTNATLQSGHYILLLLLLLYYQRWCYVGGCSFLQGVKNLRSFKIPTVDILSQKNESHLRRYPLTKIWDTSMYIFTLFFLIFFILF